MHSRALVYNTHNIRTPRSVLTPIYMGLMLSCKDGGHGVNMKMDNERYSLSPGALPPKKRHEPFLRIFTALLTINLVHTVRLSHPSTRGTDKSISAIWTQASQSHKRWVSQIIQTIQCIDKHLHKAPLTHSLRCAPIAKMVTVLRLMNAGSYKCVRRSLTPGYHSGI